MVPTVRLVPSKLEPIAIDDSNVVRPRVIELFSPLRPVTVVSAMPGSGKSVAIRQFVEQTDRPVAWVNVDSLDVEPSVFWTHVLAALMLACPELDEEPLMLLRERTASDPVFLVALIAQLERSEIVPVVVLDGGVHRLPPAVFDCLAQLVERAHHSIRLVVACQVDPGLPIGRWRSHGWLKEIRGADLRFTDTEAIEVANRTEIGEVDEAQVVGLNQVVDGWPLAVRLGLGSGQAVSFDVQRLPAWPEADPSTSAELGAQLMATLDEDETDVALRLSVLEELDPSACLELVGDDAGRIVASLLRHDMLLKVVDHRTGTMRFHPLIRRLLESELAWRDPVRRLELHLTAASVFEARGDVRSAYHHLAAIGETERARSLLVEAAVGHVDRGDLTTLQHLTAQLPAVSQVDRIELALDLGLIAAWGDGTEAARRWWSRAAELAADLPADTPRSGTIELRLRQLECMIAVFDADLESAVPLVGALPRPSAGPITELGAHMTFVATRALVAARHPSARHWVNRIRSFDGPPIVTNVTIPALRAWQSWNEGDLAVATELSEALLAWLEENHIDVHHWAIDSLITAAWCRLSRGDLVGTRELAERAQLVATVIPSTWNRAQAAYLSGSLALASGNAEEAFRIASEMRVDVPGTTSGYAGRLVHLAAEAAIALRRLDVANELTSELPQGPARALLRSRLQPMSVAQLEARFADRASWAAVHRMRAEAILAMHSPGSSPSDDLVDVVAAAGESGWVSPFLNLGPRADRTLRTVPLDRLHPALLAVLDAIDRPHGATAGARAVPRLTPREMSLLELLPTHLSYAEMGERMYLSVNTVKASLKGLYRKLGAHTRAEAVEVGQHHGLI